jgi:hypothetical protein
MAKATVMRSCCDRFKNEEHHPDCHKRSVSRKTFRVRLTYDVPSYADVEVEANSEEEAGKKAVALALSEGVKFFDVSDGNNVDEDEIYVNECEEV